MQERVAELIGGSGASTSRRRGRKSQRKADSDRPTPTISTFHAQCVRILRRHAKAIGFPPAFSIYDRSDPGIARPRRPAGIASSGHPRCGPATCCRSSAAGKNASVKPDQAAYDASTDREHFAAAGVPAISRRVKGKGSHGFRRSATDDRKLYSTNIRRFETKRRPSTITCWSTSIKTPTAANIGSPNT